MSAEQKDITKHLTVQDVLNGIAMKAADADIECAANGGLMPKTFVQTYLMAATLFASGVTKYRSTTETLVAIDFGRSVGLTPTQSAQSVMVVNGSPALFGDVALALVMASPELIEFSEELEGDIDSGDATAICKVVREKPTANGKSATITRTERFSTRDAMRAGLLPCTDKRKPWGGYPKRMLQMRARTLALRNTFPDLLKGIGIYEEVIDRPFDPSQMRAPLDATETPVMPSGVTAKPRKVANTAPSNPAGEKPDGAPQSDDAGTRMVMQITATPEGGTEPMGVADRIAPNRWRIQIQFPEGDPLEKEFDAKTLKVVETTLERECKMTVTLSRVVGIGNFEIPESEIPAGIAPAQDHEPEGDQDDDLIDGTATESGAQDQDPVMVAAAAFANLCREKKVEALRDTDHACELIPSLCERLLDRPWAEVQKSDDAMAEFIEAIKGIKNPKLFVHE